MAQGTAGDGGTNDISRRCMDVRLHAIEQLDGVPERPWPRALQEMTAPMK